MKPRSLLALLCFAGTCHAQAAPLTPADMQADLRYLRDVWSHTDRSLSAGRRPEFDRIVDAALARSGSLTAADFALQVSRAVAVARNGHSEAQIGAYLHGLPVGFAWFADGLYVIRAQPSQAKLLGARVEKFGSLTAAEADAGTAPFISGTDARIHSLSAVYLRTLEVLQAIGASRSADSAVLQLRMPDGRLRKVRLDMETAPDPAKVPDWMGVVPAPADLPGRWVHVLDALPKLPALYRNVTNLDREWLQDGRIFYLRSNYIWGTDANRYELFANLIGILQVEVAERRPRYAIVDLRLNHGGDFFNTIDFARALPRLIPADGRIFVLVGPDTFSAALATAAMLKGQGGDRVVLVGDSLGDDAVFWSEGQGLTLPHSRIVVSTATKKHDWSSRCDDIAVCYWGNTAFGPDHVSLQPGIRIAARFADYAAGRDPVLEAALNGAR